MCATSRESPGRQTHPWQGQTHADADRRTDEALVTWAGGRERAAAQREVGRHKGLPQGLQPPAEAGERERKRASESARQRKGFYPRARRAERGAQSKARGARGVVVSWAQGHDKQHDDGPSICAAWRSNTSEPGLKGQHHSGGGGTPKRHSGALPRTHLPRRASSPSRPVARRRPRAASFALSPWRRPRRGSPRKRAGGRWPSSSPSASPWKSGRGERTGRAVSASGRREQGARAGGASRGREQGARAGGASGRHEPWCRSQS